ncbi:fumarylacetoacetate hydrolase family protein [Rhodococcoides fascians]|uniref:fumarylacetoacetate hydrolase family protein n=1 Tax=Rhodococcoides fascians TaxID=1828 RepID=UPI00050C01FB|nr:fumarylacetoacetate hydrolase family protein [Rhodococcus fascians]
MKFATFRHHGSTHTGVVDADAVYPIGSVDSMLELLRGGLDAALVLGKSALRSSAIPLPDVVLQAPLVPPTIRDFVTFEEHVAGVRRSIDGAEGVVDAWYEAPRFYFTNPYAVIGPGDSVLAPRDTRALDFELEVAAVVGRSGSSCTVEQARDHIFGYTILNDWSARDIQGREMQVNLGPSKGKDFANTLGPWIVTADELDRHRDEDGFLHLDCSVTVNGVLVGHDSLANMAWTFDAMVAYASRDTWIHPGDVLGSGTVGNGGCLAELWGRSGERTPPPLQPGDVVTLTVDSIGSVTNTIGRSTTAPIVPPARRADHERPAR